MGFTATADGVYVSHPPDKNCPESAAHLAMTQHMTIYDAIDGVIEECQNQKKYTYTVLDFIFLVQGYGGWNDTEVWNVMALHPSLLFCRSEKKNYVWVPEKLNETFCQV